MELKISENNQRALLNLERWLIPMGIGLMIGGLSLLPVGGFLVWAGVLLITIKGKLRDAIDTGEGDALLGSVRWLIWAVGLFGIAYVLYVLAVVLVMMGFYALFLILLLSHSGNTATAI